MIWRPAATLCLAGSLALAAPAFGQTPLNLDDPARAQVEVSTPAPAAPPAPAVSAPVVPPVPAVSLEPPAPVAAAPVNAGVPIPAAGALPVQPHVSEWIGQDYPVPETIEVMAEPSATSPISSHLRAGGAVLVVGVLSDPKWLQVQLPDKSIGFILASSLPAVVGGPSAAGPSPAKPVDAETRNAAVPSQPNLATIRGLAYVYDSATLLVLADNGAAEPIKVPLSNLDGFNGDPKLGLAHYLESTGAEVGCDPSPAGGYICKVGDGTDIARAALVNGVARTRPAAPADYGAQQNAAIAARRGIWHSGTAAVEAIPVAAPNGSNLPPGQYVAGVPYEEGPVPPVFAAGQPSDGMAFIDGQPFTLDQSIPAPLVYEDGIGWGFWDRSLKWRQAPDRWAARLELAHPRGEGIREVELQRHGFVPHDAFFGGPAMLPRVLPGQGAVLAGRGPYIPATFAVRPPVGLVGRPGGGFGSPVAIGGFQPMQGGFPRSTMPETFQRGGPAMSGRVEFARPFAPGLPQHEAPMAQRGFEPRMPPGRPPMAFERQPAMMPAVQRVAPSPMMVQRLPPMMVQRAPAPMMVQRAPAPMMAQRVAPPMMFQHIAPAPMMIARPVAMPMVRPAAPPPPRPAPPLRTH